MAHTKHDLIFQVIEDRKLSKGEVENLARFIDIIADMCPDATFDSALNAVMEDYIAHVEVNGPGIEDHDKCHSVVRVLRSPGNMKLNGLISKVHESLELKPRKVVKPSIAPNLDPIFPTDYSLGV